ncbi:hypothetical protein M885DRAFT_590778 [Pelagophyceae sp. CCMP2097]|nr:hypothetical protein M885DRAFT_590778 [Pelagophyceae sp. CCMP2097]
MASPAATMPASTEKKKRKASDEASAEPSAKKKKMRWRNQKVSTVVLHQLAYTATAAALKQHLVGLGLAPGEVRLVSDAATREAPADARPDAARRVHAGLAYVVFESAEAAASAIVAIHGTLLLERKVVASLLEGDDESGRFHKGEGRNLVDAGFVVSHLAKHGLPEDTLDAGVVGKLRACPRALVASVIRDVAKKIYEDAPENANAYALGVLKRTLKEEVFLEDSDKLQLGAGVVDRLVDQALGKAPQGLFAKADVDARAKSYMREFSQKDVEQALDDVTKRLVTEQRRIAEEQKRAPKKRSAAKKASVSSVSAFLMGVLRDIKKGVPKPSSKGKGKGKGKGGRGKGDAGKGKGKGEAGKGAKGGGRGGAKGGGRGRGKGAAAAPS